MILACDIGATRIKLGLVNNGQVLAQDVLASNSGDSLAKRLPHVATALRQLCKNNGVTLSDCAGVSVAVASLVDTTTGHAVAEYGRFRDLPTIDFRGWAKDELALPLAIENDARMATIGEWRHGAGRGCDNLVMITLGTGLGTAAIIEGRVLRGKHGQAGCLGGHLTLRYGGNACGCGNIGCAEAEASTAFLSKIAKSQANFAQSALAKEPVLDFAAVFRNAAAGDVCAEAVRDHSLLVWSSLAVSLIHAYDPELVIFGGGIMASADVILPAVRAHVARHAHTPWGKVRVAASQLGDAAALVAGEWLLQEQLSQL